jgi:predicted amidohydrolase YtcJ
VAAARADLVLTGGRIWTGIERRRPEDTLVVRDGRIAAIGPYDELSWAVGPRTRVIPLGGRLLLPAFQDGHVHPIRAGLLADRCDLSGAADLGACLDRVRAWSIAHPEAPWVLGEGWTTAAFPGGIPRAGDLDTAVADRPVLLRSADRQGAWVNSAALEVAGIRSDTPDPSGGRIERGSGGEPLGMLLGRAVALIAELAPRPTASELEAALQRGQARLHALGVGGWLDASVRPAEEAAYLALAGRGELHARVSLALRWDDRRWTEQIPELLDRRARIADATEGQVRAGCVKLVQDGVVETATAALLEPYLDVRGRPSRERGASLHEAGILREIVVALDRERLSIHVHAMGDRAVREVLDALTVARKVNGPRDSRHTIAHAALVARGDLVRFEALGVVASVQPSWAVDDPRMRSELRPLLGTDRANAMFPFGSLARSRAALAIGSDWPATTADPRAILDAATTRLEPGAGRGSRPLGAISERLKPDVALRAATRGSAFAGWMEDLTGTLEVGKSADLVLLGADPLGTPGLAWRDADVLLTMVDGRVVYESPALGA